MYVLIGMEGRHWHLAVMYSNYVNDKSFRMRQEDLKFMLIYTGSLITRTLHGIGERISCLQLILKEMITLTIFLKFDFFLFICNSNNNFDQELLITG